MITLHIEDLDTKFHKNNINQMAREQGSELIFEPLSIIPTTLGSVSMYPGPWQRQVVERGDITATDILAALGAMNVEDKINELLPESEDEDNKAQPEGVHEDTLTGVAERETPSAQVPVPLPLINIKTR